MGSPWTPYLFLAPAVLYIGIFQLFPLLQEVWLSFTRTTLLNPTLNVWVGLANYQSVLGDPSFRQTLLTTLLYVTACVVGSVGLGLVVALLLNGRFPGRAVARSLVTVPWAAPGIAVALIAVWMFNPQFGLLTRVLKGLGIDTGENGVLDNPSLALAAILMTTIWQLVPFVAVVLLSALQSVPQELVEAAQVDGAGRWMIFRVVTWQVLKPTIGLVAVLMTIWSLRRFELIWLMTRGGPLGSTRTLVIDLYSQAFESKQLGTAAAIGMVGIVISLIVIIGSRLVARAAAKEA
ncbi:MULTISPECIES: carbohydrate ABC transporter permease [Paenarthrobacter]|uniref:Sugar ABC transporter permease n=1 Tax=Paenarthrobacter ureafaciens TaxID=37931 RepID=A0AAX3EJT0_PAEUR|nr:MULTISPECIES: sugar ABC transporter permease [Paenarthrobacter]AMB38995.1 sugar ABC transporter [Arthrobacter sp. ATCC 21022]NKR12605.1 sugar ABC transporter [Arthrobacter sp. M5]NKR15921.1 sugar ABC transporter [Arthrobacter sp. M6]OEH59897.1 sugar ABC transporter [Arthrobacter sp. D4]OEH59957.1 sugar ABC transporter [Arthrobacter sp. D2]BCW82564.1 sugar ABC transporter [Arthrobacter sp. NicSoilE8]